MFKKRFTPVLFLSFLLSTFSPLQSEIPLPTPHTHYESFNPAAQTFALVSALSSELEPAQQALAFQVLGGTAQEGLPELSRTEAIAFLQQITWNRWRHQILEQLLHRSHILEIIPEGYEEWLPIVHDALLFFLDHLEEERILERVLGQADVPDDAQRGQKLLTFLAKTPTLQKIGQILARNPSLPQDLRQALQALENSLSTMTADELMQFVNQEVGSDILEEYQITFSNEIMAEATVGAVMQCSFVHPGESGTTDAVLKVIKPYALSAMQEELEIFDELTKFFDVHRLSYAIGAVPLSEMFQELRDALSQEIQVVNEQQNLKQASAYYSGNTNVLVPELFPFSTERVTFMELVHGEKISDAFHGQPRTRSRLARHLMDVMIVDVLLSTQDHALFHGDPHAGNVFHVLNDPEHPYRIALLDWGLSETLPRRQRESLMQLLLGVYLRDTKRLTNNVGAVVEGDLWKSPEQREQTLRIVKETLDENKERKAFDILEELIKKLARQGYQIRFNISLFIKSQITISGILSELDPELKQDKYLMKRFSRQVFRELPKRLLYTAWFPAWNSHDYLSMLSNEDVKDLQVNSSLGIMKTAGRGVWSVVRWPAYALIR